MISIIKKENNCASILLEGDLTIYFAEELNQEMNGYLNEYHNIDVDMTKVTELDSSCYQILLRAKLLSMKNNKEFNISGFSDESKQIFGLYDMENMFQHDDNASH